MQKYSRSTTIPRRLLWNKGFPPAHIIIAFKSRIETFIVIFFLLITLHIIANSLLEFASLTFNNNRRKFKFVIDEVGPYD